MRFRDLTPAQREDICNGCGGKGGIVVPPHAATFRDHCDHHDFNYTLGGTNLDRLRADRQLLAAMRLHCSNLPLLRRLRLTPWCFLYYAGVRLAGHKFFCFCDAADELDN